MLNGTSCIGEMNLKNSGKHNLIRKDKKETDVWHDTGEMKISAILFEKPRRIFLVPGPGVKAVGSQACTLHERRSMAEGSGYPCCFCPTPNSL